MFMPKVLIINNPVSGLGGKHNSSVRIRTWLDERRVNYVWFDTVPELTQPLEKYINPDIERIVVLGGDGTVRAVADYLIKHNLKTPLGIVAKGTGNIIALMLGIPTLSVTKGLDYALETPAQLLDAMLVNNKYYGLIGAGQGYDSIFIKGATRRLKRRYGFLAYIFSFLSTFFGHRNHKYKMVIDGVRYQISAKLVTVFNILSLPGLALDQSISPQDGMLNVITINPRSLWDFIKIAIVFLLRLPQKNAPKLKIYTGKNILIKEKGGQHIQLDGDVFKGRYLEVKIVPRALNVIYKKKF